MKGKYSHYWGSPGESDSILQLFVIVDHEGKLIDNPSVENIAQFFLAVIVAKAKKSLMANRKKLDTVTSKIKRIQYKYYDVLSFKYHLSNETSLSVLLANSG